MLSKDHFSNILNEPAGHVAAEILKFVAPRILYAWQKPSVPIERVMGDVYTVFHHPALRDEGGTEVHRTMFKAVKEWVDRLPDRGAKLNDVLSSGGVRAGKNLSGVSEHAGHGHDQIPKPDFGELGMPGAGWGGEGGQQLHGSQGHGQQHGGGFDPLGQLSSLPIPGLQGVSQKLGRFSSLMPGGFGKRGIEKKDGASRGIDQNNDGASRGLGESERSAIGNDSEAPGYGQEQPFAPPSGYEVYEGAGVEQVYHAESYAGPSGYAGSGSYGGSSY